MLLNAQAAIYSQKEETEKVILSKHSKSLEK